MYLDYWGLQEKPFENTPDPRFLYLSPEHKTALQRIVYAIQEKKGCSLLTGEYGCGKTLLIRALLTRLDLGQYDLALINYPMFAENEFFREILVQAGREPSSGTALELFHQISEMAFESAGRGKSCLVIIDEAQLIGNARVFEEIRLLLNLQLDDRFLIYFLLVGQPELREAIMRFPQLDQRVGIRYHLHHLSQEDTRAYIRHRLKVGGAKREIFAPEAEGAVFKASFGVARRINTLCDLALMEGCSEGKKLIDAELIQQLL